MHPHLSGDVRQHFMVVFEFDLEHGVRKGFEDHAFEHDRIFLWLWQGLLLFDSFAILRATIGPACGPDRGSFRKLA